MLGLLPYQHIECFVGELFNYYYFILYALIQMQV